MAPGGKVTKEVKSRLEMKPGWWWLYECCWVATMCGSATCDAIKQTDNKQNVPVFYHHPTCHTDIRERLMFSQVHLWKNCLTVQDSFKFSKKLQIRFFSVHLWRPTSPPGSVQFSSVTQWCPTLCDPMNCSMPGLPVHHQLPEFTQTHVHWVDDAIQQPHPLSSPSLPALNLSQHQGLFQWVSSSHQVAKILEFQLQHQSFQWTSSIDLL